MGQISLSSSGPGRVDTAVIPPPTHRFPLVAEYKQWSRFSSSLRHRPATRRFERSKQFCFRSPRPPFPNTHTTPSPPFLWPRETWYQLLRR